MYVYIYFSYSVISEVIYQNASAATRDETTSFTYDHVSADYGPGAGFMFLTDGINRVKSVFSAKSSM